MENPKMILIEINGLVVRHDSLDIIESAVLAIRAFREDNPQTNMPIVTDQSHIGRFIYKEWDTPDFDRKLAARIAEAEIWLTTVAARLGVGYTNVFASFTDRKNGVWSHTPPDYVYDRRFSRNWRKPNSGMIQQAIENNRIGVKDTVMVGNGRRDEIAADRLGIKYVTASVYFEHYTKQTVMKKGRTA